MQLRRRRSPNQDRSREAVERILDASRDLLAEHGVEKLTTRRIAARADVNVSTLYQFFPNKHAIVYTLYEDWLSTAKSIFHEADSTLHQAEDWRTFFSDLLHRMQDSHMSADIKAGLKQAMTLYEDLRKLDHDHTNWAVGKISGYIEHFGPACSRECKHAIAVLLLERDHALAHHEIRHGETIAEHLYDLTRDALLHLLERCLGPEDCPLPAR